jgi:poly(A) polymerase
VTTPAVKLEADWLTARETRAVFDALARAGLPVRAVGGAVRNTLLGERVCDVDLATPATPQQVTAAAGAAGLNVAPTGLKHGTVTVVSGGRPFEVTTLRRDVETDGRHAVVAFTDDWSADAARRDFTINALYCDPDGVLFDPLGGYDDVLARRVRFIGDASQRIGEDYLRILRFFRFGAQYGAGTLDAAGLAACAALRDGLTTLSGERVRHELEKLLIARRGPEIAAVMHEHGYWPALLGTVVVPAHLAAVARLDVAQAGGADFLLRLGALAGLVLPEDGLRLADRLRLSLDERDRLALLAVRGLAAKNDERDVRRAIYAIGSAEAYGRAVLLAAARDTSHGTASEDWQRQLTIAQSWPKPVFPLQGRDVLAAGVAAGPVVGRLLAGLERWWVDHDFRPDRAALLERLAAVVRASDG